MSRRLQVLFDDKELAEIQRAAEREQMTVSEWVRKALRAQRGDEPLRSPEAKLAAVRAAVGHAFPSGDIEQMLAEIDAGRAGAPEPYP